MDRPPPATVSVLVGAERVVVRLGGHVDLALADDLDRARRDVVDSGRSVLVDVSAVDSIDSVGLSFLIRVAGGPDGRPPVALQGPSPRVDELLRLVEAHHLFVWVDEPTEGPPSGPPGDRPSPAA